MVSICLSSMRDMLCSLLLVKPQPSVPCLAILLFLCSQTCSEACAVDENGTMLLCRSCGHEVATEADINSVHSPLALSHRNDSLLGDRPLHIQLLQNPQGQQFEVITFRTADVAKRWPAERGFSWFPGFTWTIASCPRCGAQLGWGFQPSEWPLTVPDSRFDDSELTFLALITDRLLREDFAPSLLIPKSFSS